MKTRRRRCVPSPEPENDSKHFMKYILPPPDHTKEIGIPDEFIIRYGNELDNVATITVPDGCDWDIELKKCGSEVFFCNNWQQFVEYYSIYYGCYLDFKYEGNSKFNVVIYDATSVEISYPFQTRRRTNGEPNIKCPSSASKRSKDITCGSNPINTSFRSKASHYAYVPSEFAKEHLKPNVPFMLQNSQQKQWEVSGVLDRPGKPAMRITNGIRRFLRENKLSDGVTLYFKLIKRKPVVVLQVTTSRTAEKEVRESKHFKKAILPSPIHDKEIRIPEDFIIMFGNELKNVVTVTVLDGLIWKMDLKKCGEDVYFCNKWQQFAEYYSLRYGCFLSFKYEGNSNFSVIIFDATSVEICYPSKTPSTSGETNNECSRPRKRSKVETSESQGNKVKHMSKNAYKRAEDAANAFNPKNPHFRSKITTGRHAYVPYIFAPQYLKLNVPIKLVNSNGDEWEVFCALAYKSRSSTHKAESSAMQITQGFSQFIRQNNLSYGDYCVFELIQESPVVLKVTIFRVVDYCD